MPVKIENIYCIGRNYVKHAKELGNSVPKEPLVFLKTNSSVRTLTEGRIGFDDPSYAYEAEIIVRIGKDAEIGSNGSWDLADKVTLGVDLTRRKAQAELKNSGHPWTTAKSFAGSALIGNFIEKEKFQNLEKLEFSFALNGEIKQNGDSRDMIFGIPQILDYLLSFTSLKKGDLIFTGTPEGVGEISKGDKFSLRFLEIDSVMNGVL